MDSAAVKTACDGEDPVEVVVLLQHDHDLQHPLHHRHPLLHVVCLQDGLLQVPREVGRVPDHPKQVGTPLVLVLPGPGEVDKLRGLYRAVVLELYQGELASDLDRMERQKLRPVLLRALYVDLDRRRRPVEVENDLLGALVVVQPPLDHLADGLHPLPHALASHPVQEGGQRVQQVRVLREVVEMLELDDFNPKTTECRKFQTDLINPMLEDIEDSELDWLGILFAEPLQILIEELLYFK